MQSKESLGRLFLGSPESLSDLVINLLQDLGVVLEVLVSGEGLESILHAG